MNRDFLTDADDETRAEWDEMDKRYARFQKEFKGLSCRAFKCFYLHKELVGDFNFYDCSANEYKECDEYDTAEKVKAAIISGKLHPKSEPHPRNYGWVTHIEVCKFFGLPNPRKGQKAKRLKQLEEQVRKLKREILETAKEEEFQKHFSDKLLAEATANLIEAHFKTPATPKSLWDHIDQHEQ